MRQIINRSKALPSCGQWHFISVEFLPSFLTLHFVEQLVVASRNVGCFLWLVLHCYWCFFLLLLLFQVWCLKCYHCSDAVTQCHPSGNRSTVLECTPTMNRCYMRKITKKESEDQLDVGCTNEAGCTIHHKQCASSGDCTSSCCESDLCNSGLSSKTCAISSSLLITGYLVISLLLWVPSVHQDIFQENNEEGKFPDKNSRQQVKVIIMNLRLSSVTRGLEGYLSRVHWGCGYC